VTGDEADEQLGAEASLRKQIQHLRVKLATAEASRDRWEEAFVMLQGRDAATLSLRLDQALNDLVTANERLARCEATCSGHEDILAQLEDDGVIWRCVRCHTAMWMPEQACDGCFGVGEPQ
jgi:hypothetical protein